MPVLKYQLPKGILVLLLIFTSCSSIYEAIPGNEVYSVPRHMIKLERLSASPYLFEDRKDPGRFYVMLRLSEIPKGKKLMLSRLKIELENRITGDKAAQDQTIQLNYAADTSIVRHRETLNQLAIDNGQIIELEGRVSYDLHYNFTRPDHKHHSPKMLVKFQFNIDGDGKHESIVKTVDFKRTKYLNVSGD